MDSIEASLVEIYGGTPAIDPNRFAGQIEFGDLENDRTVCKEDHSAFGLRIAAESYGIETQSRVLVEPHQIGVGENNLHPRFAGGVDPIAAYERHIDNRFEAFLLADRLNSRIALEVGDVAQ
jgi:hypothetical protein